MPYIQGGIGFGGTSQAEAEAAAVETAGSVSSTYTPFFLYRNIPLEVTVFYADRLGSGRQARRVTASVGAPNRAPTLSGVSDTTFAENDTAAVAAYTGADADGDALTWSLAGADASAFRWQGTGLTRSLRFAAAPDFEAKSTYGVTARVSDGSATATQAVTVRVTNVDEAPVLSGVADTTFAENGTGAAATYTATDPEGDAVTWSLTGADRDTLRLSSGTLSFRSAPNYEAPADTGADNAYEVRVRAFDGPLGDSLAVTVRVTNVEEPGRVSLSSSAPQVGSPLSAALSDPDGGVSGAAWQWRRLASRSSAGAPIASATSSSYTPQAADVEQWLVAGASYTDAQGAGKSAGDTTAAWVVSVPSAPKDLKAAPGNGRAALTWTAADSNGASITRYSVRDSTKGGSWSGWSVVPGAGTARDTTRTGLTNGSRYFFQVRARNRVGDGAAADTTATPKATPQLTLSGPDSVGFAENETDSVAAYRAVDSEGGAITWSKAGPDTDRFDLKSGILSFKSPPNYEVPADADRDSLYRVEVKARSGPRRDSLAVKVRVTDVEEAGRVSLSSTAPKVNTTLSAALTDPDGGVDTKTWRWQWQRRATASSPWTNVGAQAQADSVYQGAPYTPVSDDAGYQLRATVGYRDARGSGKSAASAATGAVAASAPSKPKDLKAAAGNRQVVLTWAAADSHGAWITSYSVRDSTKGGSWSGWAVVPEDKPKDGSARDTTRTGLTNDTTYFFQVRAGNRVGKGPAAAATARPKAPSLELTLTGPTDTTFAEKGTGTVATYSGRVAIGGSGQAGVTWSLSGADQGDFTLPGGRLSFKTAPDFENPADANADNVYRVQVKGNAGGGLRDSLAVKVTVTDVDEPPGKPTNVSVSAPSTDGHSKLNVTWTAPSNSGKPAISGYTVRYCYTAFAGGETVPGAVPQSTCSDTSTGTSPSTTLTGLLDDTLYRVKVKATNDEGTGPWSTEGTGSTRPRNRAPTISGPSSPSVKENVTSVATYTASDPDGDKVSWSPLEGTDKGKFNFTNGALSFKTAPNYEAGTTSFRVKVKAVDNGTPKKSATKTVTVSVTDVNEPPGKPTSVSVSPASTDGHSKLDVSWTAPSNSGKPAISAYTVRYCYTAFASKEEEESGAGGQSSCSDKSAGTGTSTTLTGLYANTLYRVKVKATNAEGTGPWSTEGTGTTRRRPNRAPTISGPSSPSVKENTTSVASYSATDPDGDAVTWTLEGTDKSKFNLSGSGALSFKSAPDYEAGTTSFSVKVKATDDGSPKKSATKTVSVSVTDVNEPPGKPTSVSVSPPSTDGHSKLNVTWTAPSNSGKPAISAYTVRYCYTAFASKEDEESGTGQSSCSDKSAGTGTSTTLTGLYANTLYRVKVKATNAEGTGSWSTEGTGTTRRRPNRAPTISGPSSPSVKENTTSVASYSASDPDGDDITWSLLGTDKSKFSLSGSGALSFKSAPDYEAGTTSFSVKVRATDDGSPKKSATRTVSVSVTDVNEPPGKPTSVSAGPNGYKILRVSWTAPSNSGKPAISSFTVQYCKTNQVSFCDSYGIWSSKTVGASASQTNLTGLAVGTSYTVQVRARNAEGSGPWSSRATGTTQIGGTAEEQAAKILAEDGDLAVRVAPNPFNPGTTIYFRTPAPGQVSLAVYNLAGQAVARLLPGAYRPAGTRALYWDGRDQRGRPAAAGIYLYLLRFEDRALIGKMTLLR